jgi:hypothetical protein
MHYQLPNASSLFDPNINYTLTSTSFVAITIVSLEESIPEQQ